MASRFEAFRDRDLRVLWHPYSKLSSLREGPLPVIVKGEGPFLYDITGKRYFDAISSWWCCNLGHGHRRIITAIKKQAERLQHSILGNLTHPSAVELAERIAALFPASGKHVLFASDGACAVEAALKIAVQYFWNLGRPEKSGFIALSEGYHGDTLGALSAGFIRSFHRPFERLVFPCFFAEAPFCSKCRYEQSPERCALPCLESMARLLEEHAESLAGVIVEPLCQGAAGMRMYTPRYLRELDVLCRKHGVLLIVDEIAMGMGRTGRMFAFEHAGIDPPIVCIGKGLAAGYLPISATVVAEFVWETFRDTPRDCTFYHGHTFSGNPIAAAAAIATLTVYDEEKIVAKAESTGRYMKQILDRFRGHASVRDVRAVGMVGAIEVGLKPGGVEALRRLLVGRGYLIRPLGNVVYMMPPLITPPELIAEAAGALLEALEEI